MLPQSGRARCEAVQRELVALSYGPPRRRTQLSAEQQEGECKHRRLHQISGHGSRADRGALLVLLPLLIAAVHTIALSTKPVLP